MSEEHRELLLDMLSTHRRVEESSVDALAAHDWDTVLRMARRHRVTPLLHWRLRRERSGVPVPRTVSDALASGFAQSAIRALLVQRELLLTHRILADAGIPHVALKGAYLAFHAYPHPALRPLRDLDILVSKKTALEAYRALLAGGLTRHERLRGDPEASVEVSKHLPALRSPSGRLDVEIHTQLSNPAHSGVGRPGLVDDPHLWHRTISRDLAGASLTYLSPTDLLLHLVVHAVYDHRFGNGPLVLSDSACLLESQPIDWPLFWQRAHAGGWTRGCLLLLKMVERYFGEQPIAWPEVVQEDPASLEGMLNTASLLTLRDVTSQADVQLGSELRDRQSIGRKLGVLLRRVFPSRKRIAATYPVSLDSSWLYLWYVAEWWRQLTRRLPAYLASRQDRHVLHESQHDSQLGQWLRD